MCKYNTDGEYRSNTIDELWDSHLWLLVPLAILIFLYIVDTTANEYPFRLGGLYLDFAEEIKNSGWLFPERIPHYKTDGVPYAYPPITFYILNVLQMLPNVGKFSSLLILPKIWWTGTIIVTYYLSSNYFDSRPVGATSASFVAFSLATDIGYRHGGGTTRAGAFMFVILGCYISLKLFQTKDSRWILPGALGFGFALMTHPIGGPAYGFLFAITYFVLDRSLVGLTKGIAVAGLGLIIASPWWIGVSLIHGPEILFRTGGGHLSNFGINRLQWSFSHIKTLIGSLAVSPRMYLNNLIRTETIFIWYLGVIGGIRAFEDKRMVVLAWTIISSITYPRFARFFVLLYAGYGLVSICRLIWERYDQRVTKLIITDRRHINRVGALLCVVFLIAILIPSLTVGMKNMDGPPPTINEAHIQGFNWAQNNTESDAAFVVTDGPVEWFPHISNRTQLVAQWGAEWQPDPIYWENKMTNRQISQCSSGSCLERIFDEDNLNPDYVYVPHQRQPELASDLYNKTSYRERYNNTHAVIFER